jgi:hypothetical protein
MTARKSAETESFDAFWAEVRGRKTTTICGVTVAVPNDIPFGFNERFEALKDSERQEDASELVAMFFGDGLMEQWEKAGIGYFQLLTILTWGMAQATGQDMSFAEAYEAVTSADIGGKAPANRAERRAAPKKRSAAGGGQSKRTSSASTTSARKTSRA